jgi:hypothetical protein
MPWPNGAEMAMIEGNHQVGAQPFGERDDRGISASQREVGVLFDELGDASPFVGERRLNIEAAQAAQECRLDGGAKSAAREVRDFGNYESWNHQLQIGAAEHCQTGSMVYVAGVEHGDQGAGVKD